MRRLLMMLVLIVAFVALPLSARAGGWSVVTLDSSPTEVQADIPFTIGFMVRQHGETPMPGLSPRIRFVKQSAAKAHGSTLVAAPTKGEYDHVTVTAKAEGEVGHYTATITLPVAGTWTWEIDAFGPVATMSPLTVMDAPASAATREQPENEPRSLAAAHNGMLIWGAGTFISVAAMAIALAVVRQRRRVGAPS